MQAVIISDLPNGMFHKPKRYISHHPGQLENSTPTTFGKGFVGKLGRRLDDILSNTFKQANQISLLPMGSGGSSKTLPFGEKGNS